MTPVMRQVIIWSNDDPVYWRKYALLGLNELRIGLTYQLLDFSF